MKIYTKKGDSGKTSLIGGTRVPKNHAKIEAYGTIDELNSWMGLVKEGSKQNELHSFIENIQVQLFNIAALLAEDKEASKMQLPSLEAVEVEALEKSIDAMSAVLPPLKNFVLPGGSVENANAHVARCVCRRAERLVVALNELESVDPLILQYLNRLSDWLFVFARYMSFSQNKPEILWRPNK